jgi:hypothetical protein
MVKFMMDATAEQVVQRFRHIYIGDSLVEKMLIDFQRMECTFLLSTGSILNESLQPNIFDPAQRYQPAILAFHGVRLISFPESDFYLNSTIVEFEATSDGSSNLVSFYLEMTGGSNNESFVRSIVIKAQTFCIEAVSDKLAIATQ